jgi:hypothetical protein
LRIHVSSGGWRRYLGGMPFFNLSGIVARLRSRINYRRGMEAIRPYAEIGIDEEMAKRPFSCALLCAPASPA